MLITISVVIPVYNGEHSLPSLVQELARLSQPTQSPNGINYVVQEVILVHDCGPNYSDRTIEDLSEQYPFLRPIWLTRNYGQHPATLSGMASSISDWVVTMDEDGQQNPADIGMMLDMALADDFQIVYARPINPPPHGLIRNIFSAVAKKLALKFLGVRYQAGVFNSFRLIDGEISRIIAAYCGDGVYLDVGLFWVASRIGYCPVELRAESRPSSYSFPKLFTHFWRMGLTSGTRPLRLITIAGAISLFLSLLVFGYAFYGKFIAKTVVEGWTSILVIIAFFSGLIMVSLGVVAEYLALTMGIVMGKPLYVVASKPTRVIKK